MDSPFHSFCSSIIARIDLVTRRVASIGRIHHNERPRRNQLLWDILDEEHLYSDVVQLRFAFTAGLIISYQ